MARFSGKRQKGTKRSSTAWKLQASGKAVLRDGGVKVSTIRDFSRGNAANLADAGQTRTLLKMPHPSSKSKSNRLPRASSLRPLPNLQSKPQWRPTPLRQATNLPQAPIRGGPEPTIRKPKEGTNTQKIATPRTVTLQHVQCLAIYIGLLKSPPRATRSHLRTIPSMGPKQSQQCQASSA